ncbi:MAG: BamA/TamA family outer membrane protein [Saprospiraceae bacterium]|nr:BamA/TamA family outer membrane protein [Saprospiraceae bacterium]
MPEFRIPFFTLPFSPIRNLLICVLIWCAPSLLHAQTDSTATWVRIEKINLEGNRKTRPATILRELKLRVGDSIPAPAFADILERNRLLLLNLGIFTEATISVQEWAAPGKAVLNIKVTEAWFVYPVPILALSDRNFNVWWNEFDRSLKRLNYGLDWSQLNLSGRADILKVKAQFGFTNRYELAYRSQGLNHQRTLGLEASLAYSRAHELSYKTSRNKLDFLRVREAWQVEQVYAGITLISRPKLFKSQTFSLEYRDNRVTDTIAKVLNPDFFLDGQNRQRHFSAVYSLTLDYRDFRPYPLKGWRGIVELRKNGLLPSDDLQIFRAFAEWDQYFLLNKRVSLELVGKVRTSLPRKKPPQSNNQALGYGSNLVRGYDYYVVDGLDFALLRSSWHFLLFDGKFNLGRAMPVKAYRKLPLRLYFAVNSDLGYANDPYYAANNPLSNRWLLGYGPGLDFVFYYDKSIRCEWTWNDLGEGGLYVRINTGF